MKSAFLALGILAAASLPALAAPITYTDMGIGSGRLGGISFTNSAITVSFTSDTSTITGSPGFYTNTTGTGSVSVAGVGSAILFGAYAFVNNSYNGTGAAGIATSSGSILDTLSDALKSYALGSIGPTSGNPFINANEAFATSSGNFVISSINGNTTFSTSTVPLPASAPMFGAALLALAGFGFGMNRWVAPKGKQAAA